MSKRMSKSSSKPVGPRRWQASTMNAVEFATFRWHANSLENKAISLYVTNREKFPQICQAFILAANRLRALTNSCSSNEDCPDGWHCSNGECQPDNN